MLCRVLKENYRIHWVDWSLAAQLRCVHFSMDLAVDRDENVQNKVADAIQD